MQHHLKMEASKMLKRYADVLGNRGCNDKSWPKGWTDDQKRQFIIDYNTYNGSIEDIEWDLEHMRCPMDFAWASYLSHLMAQS